MNIWQFTAKSLTYSPLRALEYEELNKNELPGKVLDLGGGEKASYLPLLKGNFTIISLNIDEKMNPTHIADITKPFPLKDHTFDAAISFNTFEHIPEFETTFKETFRVLKKGGRFIFSTPFLHQVHGSPNDYWRYTSSCLEKLLVKHGFKVKQIIPLGKGIFVARYSLLYGAIPRIFRPFFAAWAWLLDATLATLSSRYRKLCTQENYPLGYFVYAEKH
ncbi:MAG: class I SAM-dependent methyltransferase [Candidatus Woesearchaeota archaeon]